jgi:hypothetical protein
MTTNEAILSATLRRIEEAKLIKPAVKTHNNPIRPRRNRRTSVPHRSIR